MDTQHSLAPEVIELAATRNDEERQVMADAVVGVLAPQPQATNKAPRKRRTSAEMELERQVKAAKVAEKERERLEKAARKLDKKAAAIEAEVKEIVLLDGEKEKRFPVLSSRTQWTVKESKALIDSKREWHDEQEKSKMKAAESMQRIWIQRIPLKMGEKFGSVRTTPDDKQQNSPYKARWGTIKKWSSDYNLIECSSAHAIFFIPNIRIARIDVPENLFRFTPGIS
jgi:hypothetical protein